MNAAWADHPTYPTTKRTEFTEELHGTQVPDPYRWLEDDVRKSPEVKAWVEAESKFTNDYLKAIPEREKIQKKLTELWNYEKFSAPSKHGKHYVFSKNNGLQNQFVVYTQDSLNGEPKLLLDPNSWSKDGTIALSGTAFSDDGKLVAYSQSEAGSDWTTWKVLDVESRKLLPDELKWVKFSNVSWTKDGKGFFYSRFDEPKKEAQFQSLNLNQKLMHHKLGTSQAEDVIVYQRPDQPTWSFSGSVTDDGKYLVFTSRTGTDARNRVFVKDLSKPLTDAPVEVVDNFDNDYTLIEGVGPILYFRTDLNAPNGRVIAIDMTKPAKENWKEIIPQAKENLRGVNLVGGLLIASYLKDARTQVKMFQPDGKFVREVEFPGIGTAAGFGGKPSDTETFYSFSSYAVPPTIYRYDLKTGESKQLRQAQVKFDPSQFETKQIFYTSKDGTKVPMFITSKKGLKLDGQNPTLLYGYGGFNIPLTPGFSVGPITWMEMGGVYAVANLRGGGEYGKDWHKAGTKERKQNVFDDFISAAEYLIAEKYTSTPKLAIQGGSNGGLLIGACMTQRPDLFGACLPHVGVMDMLRFHKFTAGRYWVDDYGSPDKAEDFKSLIKYSPYHNLKPGVKYPPTMVITADTDDRVVPGHSFKFAAQLQYCQAGDAPVLARIETRAGHGAGKPTAKVIEELADEYAFLYKNLKMK
ncbi:prolyl oligopeptidase family serine peptidase [Telmatocola sphagniphila]